MRMVNRKAIQVLFWCNLIMGLVCPFLLPLSPQRFNFGHRCFGLYQHTLTYGTPSRSLVHSSWDNLYIYVMRAHSEGWTTCTYIHHGLVGHGNEFPCCECELLVGCGDDDGQTALKWDRSSHPVAPPGSVSHAFSLDNCTYMKLLWDKISYIFL
jgi:hypothetical protein